MIPKPCIQTIMLKEARQLFYFGPTSTNYTLIVNSTHRLYSQTMSSGDGWDVSNYISGRGGENFGFSAVRGGGLGPCRKENS
jgi:hypothetical protein